MELLFLLLFRYHFHTHITSTLLSSSSSSSSSPSSYHGGWLLVDPFRSHIQKSLQWSPLVPSAFTLFWYHFNTCTLLCHFCMYFDIVSIPIFVQHFTIYNVLITSTLVFLWYVPTTTHAALILIPQHTLQKATTRQTLISCLWQNYSLILPNELWIQLYTIRWSILQLFLLLINTKLAFLHL